MSTIRRNLLLACLSACSQALIAAARAETGPGVVYRGESGPGAGLRVVLVAGDEEYRSEEALPQLGRILAAHHGFTCTVLFPTDPADGTINPDVVDNIPGLEALEDADLMVIATRFRALPDAQMQHIDRYLRSGRPILGMRTATHAFRFPADADSAYRHYDFQSDAWEGGFGRKVLGETWIAHHGRHGVESTRGVVAEGAQGHPVVRGCEDIWGPTDVYRVRLPLPEGCIPLVMGQVLTGMSPDDPPVTRQESTGRDGKVDVRTPNGPMMPIAWIRTAAAPGGDAARVFTTTMGSSTDLESEGFRRLLVNAVYWCLGLEDRIPPRANVDLVGPYQPTPFGFGGHQKGRTPSYYQ